jgi:hypothetical protein
MTAPAADELRSLWRWLVETPQVRVWGRPCWLAAKNQPGEMGSTFEAIMVIVGTGLSAAQLAVAIAEWHRNRGSRAADLTLEINGNRVAVDGERDLVARIVAALPQDDPAQPEPTQDGASERPGE